MPRMSSPWGLVSVLIESTMQVTRCAVTVVVLALLATSLVAGAGRQGQGLADRGAQREQHPGSPRGRPSARGCANSGMWRGRALLAISGDRRAGRPNGSPTSPPVGASQG